MSRTKTSGRLPPECDWRPFLIEPTGTLVWTEIFDNGHPVEVEIGSGKGLFLTSSAIQFRDRNFLGIEIARKFAQFAAGRLAKNSLSNARVACADARRVFADCLPLSSVASVHIYFPDPWWKRRHKKRRIFTESLLHQIGHVLVPGGELRVASDVEEYFRRMEALIGNHGSFQPLGAPMATDAPQDFDRFTNFERKYRKQGRPIWRAKYRMVTIDSGSAK